MMRLRILSIVVLAGKLAFGADGTATREKGPRDASAPESSKPTVAVRLPQVLRSAEPKDNSVVTLPGATSPKRAPAPSTPAPSATSLAPALIAPGWHPMGVPSLPPAPEIPVARPVAEPKALESLASVVPALPRVPPPAKLSGNDATNGLIASVTAPPPRVDGRTTSPAPDPHKPVLPTGLAQESAVFCQREIGYWTLADARSVLGEPHRQRAAVDDDASENGHIYAFRDPTNRYKEFELDFDKDKGILRTVFVYPWNLTWQECRKLWGANVSATEGNKGRVFYSYVNRHLDVLVDHDGKVISLGLY
jgi:hypothetical protein